jgi:hypothetical protein
MRALAGRAASGQSGACRYCPAPATEGLNKCILDFFGRGECGASVHRGTL